MKPGKTGWAFSTQIFASCHGFKTDAELSKLLEKDVFKIWSRVKKVNFLFK